MDDGVATSIVEFAPRLMPRQLDERGSGMLIGKLQAQGLQVMLNKSTRQILGNGSVEALEFTDDTSLKTDLVVISAGIRPRDELAQYAGLQVGERGGIVVDEHMKTSGKDIFAIGECALAQGMIWGLVAPCYEMADVVVKQLSGLEASFSGFDMSTKLKLIGTDVASFGDAFGSVEGSIPIVYEDPSRGIYKRINISPDKKQLLGGILVGEAENYNLLVQMVNNKLPLPPEPHDLILGSGRGSGFQLSAMDLPDEAMICSCESISKVKICSTVSEFDLTNIGQIKMHTKAGTGCGGCTPMLDELLTGTLKSMGRMVKKYLCEHFNYTRQELYDFIRIGKLMTFREVIAKHGRGHGCELCKPAVASLLASAWNDLIAKQATIQDTNDRFLANIQKRGTYSVVPRIPGGEITPEKLIAIGSIASKYDLYTKITGGQRIDMFGARVDQLPEIWEELIAAGFESGHAYGKALRTVKSCVGSTWCRFGLHDSVSFAIAIEERYRGLRAPHKLKGGVSGCIRECAEARGKDFGIIATEKGWNLYVCGNGGANPKHAILLAQDIDQETVIRYLDRFLIFYIKTAEPLTRTAKWLASLEGGIEYLKDVVVNDCLGMGREFESEMQALVEAYKCEWKEVVNSPELRKKFRHFVNSSQNDDNIQFVPMRQQKIPVAWE
jgi:nitrite reductase (NADH) large subunit